MKMYGLVLAISILGVVFFPGTTVGQDLNCTVKVNYESIPTTNKDLLVNFESDVRDYVNNYKWTSDNLTDKTQFTLDINIQSVIGQDKYSAQVFIGSSRPIFNSNQSSAVVRLFDEQWEFTYVRGRAINHNVYAFNDLASFLDFYSYLVLGYDYDTYDNLNGTPFFQKASEIASLGRSNNAKGWTPAKSGYSRLQLIDEILNAKYAPVRSASFKYHFAGLDSMATAKERATQNIVDAIRMIGEVKKNADPQNQIIKAFFEAKYKEIAELLTGYRDPSIFLELSAIDPNHQTTYEESRKRSR
jgi:hypothetical protein